MAEDPNVASNPVASTDLAPETPSVPQTAESKPDPAPAMSGALQGPEAEELPKAADAAPGES